MIAYVSIGNSDDKLSQAQWVEFIEQVQDTLADHTYMRHGEWYSLPNSQWQNACWCVELLPQDADRLKAALADDAKLYDQDSIAWLAGETEFLSPTPSEAESGQRGRDERRCPRVRRARTGVRARARR